jgi:hypothetical protein
LWLSLSAAKARHARISYKLPTPHPPHPLYLNKNNTMQKFYFLTSVLLICFVTACSKLGNDCEDIDYSKSFKARWQDSFCLPDGKSFKIIDIEDRTCFWGFACLWEGTIWVKIELNQAGTDKDTLTILDGKLSSNEKREGFAPRIISYKNFVNDSCIINEAKDFEVVLSIVK